MTEHGSVIALDDTFEVVVDGTLAVDGLDLFNTRAFHALHRADARDGHYFVLRHCRSGAGWGAVHFLSAEPAHFESPLRGSYGGFSAAPGRELSLALMEQFVAAVEGFLRTRGARHVTLVLPPLAYHPGESSAWINVLLRAGYTIARHELNYAMEVGAPFESHLDHGNRKQLVKCERAGAVACRLGRDEYEQAYDVIEENRRKHGRSPSMSWAALREMCDRLPDRVRCFGVRQPDGRLIAAAIALVINPAVLYVFYWGEVAGAESLSPVTLLAKHLYDHCLAEQCTLLDIGTATENGVPNHGLIRYKKHLGCRESLKLTLSKAFA